MDGDRACGRIREIETVRRDWYRRRRLGFTATEAMIGVLVFTVLVLVLWRLFGTASNQVRQGTTLLVEVQAVSDLLAAIRRDLRGAGTVRAFDAGGRPVRRPVTAGASLPPIASGSGFSRLELVLGDGSQVTFQAIETGRDADGRPLHGIERHAQPGGGGGGGPAGRQQFMQNRLGGFSLEELDGAQGLDGNTFASWHLRVAVAVRPAPGSRREQPLTFESVITPTGIASSSWREF